MNIAINVSPLEENEKRGHKVRGSGFYIYNLKSSLLEYFPENKYNFFTRTKMLPKNIDLIHYPYFEPFFLTLPYVRHSKTVVTVHDMTPFVLSRNFPIGIKGKLKWLIQKRRLQKADAIITDSQSSKDDIVKYTGIEENKINIVYLAAGGEFKQLTTSLNRLEQEKKKIRTKYGLPEKFGLYVGDATANKNLPRLVRAVRQANIPFVIVGKALVTEALRNKNPWNTDLVIVQNIIKGNKNFLCLGFIPTEDLVYIYNLATVFIMPSLYEGFGLPILEAMSCGCSVITTKEGSIPEIAGNAAYYVDAYNEEDIQKGIETVWRSEKIQKELSERGLVQAKKFSWKKTAEQTIDVYKKVLI